MAKPRQLGIDFDYDSDHEDVADPLPPNQVAAVVSGTDWTTETIVSQLRRGNIQLNPRFQRRDAWKRDRKSRFIESLIVGLPIPQIVLAESQSDRGKFIVLDGKQRLLTILQYWGLGEGEHNKFALSGLTLRKDLKRKSFDDLESDPSLENDYNALCNQAIRTVVIKNWRDTNFLHTIFLRLNTGSVTLSPQELRQALLPGQFTDYVDEAAGKSRGLQLLLGTAGPDPRMRDIEILARYLAFRFFASEYPGRMKEFLDMTFEQFNHNWALFEHDVASAQGEFELGIEFLFKALGEDLARKPQSPQFNRAIFDALIYYCSQAGVRTALAGKSKGFRQAYIHLFDANSQFLKAIESDTAGAPNTLTRLQVLARAISDLIGKPVLAPEIRVGQHKTQ